MTLVDILDGGPAPKRGDLLRSNVGDRRERTWLILRVRRVKRKERSAPARYQVHMARWWELEPDMRMRLFASAERNGGQRVIRFTRDRRKSKQTFEQYMRREES